jgi:hypothetical protein
MNRHILSPACTTHTSKEPLYQYSPTLYWINTGISRTFKCRYDRILPDFFIIATEWYDHYRRPALHRSSFSSFIFVHTYFFCTMFSRSILRIATALMLCQRTAAQTYSTCNPLYTSKSTTIIPRDDTDKG